MTDMLRLEGVGGKLGINIVPPSNPDVVPLEVTREVEEVEPLCQLSCASVAGPDPDSPPRLTAGWCRKATANADLALCAAPNPVHVVTWANPAISGIDYGADTVVGVKPGDYVAFEWDDAMHNVWIVPEGSADPCDVTGWPATNQLIAPSHHATFDPFDNFVEGRNLYRIPENASGAELTFICNVNGHCGTGMVLPISIETNPGPTHGDPDLHDGVCPDGEDADDEFILCPDQSQQGETTSQVATDVNVPWSDPIGAEGMRLTGTATRATTPWANWQSRHVDGHKCRSRRQNEHSRNYGSDHGNRPVWQFPHHTLREVVEACSSSHPEPCTGISWRGGLNHSVLSPNGGSSWTWSRAARGYPWLGHGVGWVAGGGSTGEWIQVDLGEDTLLTGVVTQPRGNNCCGPQYVSSYRVQYSSDGVSFTEIPTVFNGPTADDFAAGQNTKVNVFFSELITARYVRFVVETHVGAVAMRAGVLLHNADLASCITATIDQNSWTAGFSSDEAAAVTTTIQDMLQMIDTSECVNQLPQVLTPRFSMAARYIGGDPCCLLAEDVANTGAGFAIVRIAAAANGVLPVHIHVARPGGNAPTITLSGGNDNSATNLQACTGECDADSQCAAGLTCFQRSNDEAIPGCSGSGSPTAGADWDYCFTPDAAPGQEAQAFSTFASTKIKSLVVAGADRDYALPCPETGTGCLSPSCPDLGERPADAAHNVDAITFAAARATAAHYAASSDPWTVLDFDGIGALVDACTDVDMYLTPGDDAAGGSRLQSFLINLEAASPAVVFALPGTVASPCAVNGNTTTTGRLLNGFPEADVCTTGYGAGHAIPASGHYIHVAQRFPAPAGLTAGLATAIAQTWVSGSTPAPTATPTPSPTPLPTPSPTELCSGEPITSICHGVRKYWGPEDWGPEPTPAPSPAPTFLPESQWWDLDRNRQAVQQTSVPNAPDFNMAFKWNAGDEEQDDWLPQGITGLRRDTSPQRDFIVVSWYGKADNEKKDAVRLSFVDLADLTYRHVILVVPDGNGSIQPLRCHAGGIAAVGHKIYVVDTYFGIREFDALAIWPAVASSSSTFSATNTEIMAYNYRYVMPQTRSWELPGGPTFSYISRVWTTDGSLELLSGSFTRDESTPTMLARWILGEDGLTRVGHVIQVNCRSVQGAIIRRNGTTETLFLSRSWGQAKKNLYSVELPSGYDGSLLGGFEHHDQPERAEDLFLSSTDHIWSLTETKTTDADDICPRIVFQYTIE